MIEFDNDIDQFMKKYNIEERTWDLFWSVYNKYLKLRTSKITVHLEKAIENAPKVTKLSSF